MAFSNPRNFFYIRLYGIILISGGLFLALVISKYGNLNCDRSQDRCQFETGSLLSRTQATFPASLLKGAKIEIRTTTDRYNRTTTSKRVALLPDRDLLIENYWTGREPQQIADRINLFVSNPQEQTLQVTQDERFTGIPFGLLLIAAGVFILRKLEKEKADKKKKIT
jgi:hypothetical protein